jgi:hypothetical protein
MAIVAGSQRSTFAGPVDADRLDADQQILQTTQQPKIAIGGPDASDLLKLDEKIQITPYHRKP